MMDKWAASRAYRLSPLPSSMDAARRAAHPEPGEQGRPAGRTTAYVTGSAVAATEGLR